MFCCEQFWNNNICSVKNKFTWLYKGDSVGYESCKLSVSLHSKRFCGVWEHRKIEEWDFRDFAWAENGVRGL